MYSHMLQGVYVGILGYLRVRLQRLDINWRSKASNPGKTRLSYDRLKKLSPRLFPSLTQPGRLLRWLVGPSMAEVLWINDVLLHGDSRAAIVVSTKPLLVAAYSDDLDCVALLRFPDEYAEEYSLQEGSQLLAVMNYYGADGRSVRALASDLTDGPASERSHTNFQPFIADFLSDDVARIEARKSQISADEWDHTWELGQRYLEKQGRAARDGRPPDSWNPAIVPRRRLVPRAPEAGEVQARTYRPSGRVEWASFLALTLVTLFVAALSAGLLYYLHVKGFYFVLLVPALVALGVRSMVHIAVVSGNCRNPLIGGGLGLLAGLLTYLGSYHLDMVATMGPPATYRVDWLPAFIADRKANEVLGDHFRPAANQQPNAGQVAWNWVIFVVELGCFIYFPAGGGWTRSRRPYCETCDHWQTQELLFFPKGSGKELVQGVREADFGDLGKCAQPSIAHGASGAALAVEYCPWEERSRDCPVHGSVKEVRTVANSPSGVFDYAHGWMLLRRLVLEPPQLNALAELFPSLKPRVAGLRSQIVQPRDRTQQQGSLNHVAIEFIEAPYANKLLSAPTWRIAVFLGLVPILLSPAALVLGFVGYFVFDNAASVPIGIALGLLFHRWARRNIGRTSTWFFGTVARREFRLRPDFIVSPDDREAVFIKVVPRHNWGKMLHEEATDMGFLCLDGQRGELRFEGDVERYRIPAKAVIACELAEVSFSEDAFFNHWMVVIQARHASGTWEAPFELPRVPRLRKAAAEELRERILAFLHHPSSPPEPDES